MKRTAWRWMGTGVLAGAATLWPVTALAQSSGGAGGPGSGAGSVGGNAGAPMGTGTAGTTQPGTETATGTGSAGTLGPGTTFPFVVTGPFSYHCSIHPFMTGTITVQ